MPVPIVQNPFLRLLSGIARQKFGLPNSLGEMFLGWTELGDDNQFSGIYSSVVVDGIRHQRFFPFYDYTITSTALQIAQRTKFLNAIVAWQALGSTEKALYKDKAIGRHMSGYNLFIREFMLS
jgi:hypothetical protein